MEQQERELVYVLNKVPKGIQRSRSVEDLGIAVGHPTGYCVLEWALKHLLLVDPRNRKNSDSTLISQFEGKKKLFDDISNIWITGTPDGS